MEYLFFTPPRVFGEASFGLKSTPLRAFRVEEEGGRRTELTISARALRRLLPAGRLCLSHHPAVRAEGRVRRAVGARGGHVDGSLRCAF